MNDLVKKMATDYWTEKLYVLKGTYSNNSMLTWKSCSIIVDEDDCDYFYSLTANQGIVEYTVFLAIFNALIQRYFNDDFHVYTHSYTNNEPIIIKKEKLERSNTFKEYLEIVKKEVQDVHGFLDYNKDVITNEYFENCTPYRFYYNDKIMKDYKSSFCFKISKKQKRGYSIEIHFKEDFISQFLVLHFLKNFKNWFKNLKDYLGQYITEIPIVSDKERINLLQYSYPLQFNKKDSPKTIVELFELQVNKSPEQTALVYNDRSFTYKELNIEANKLAHFLIEKYSFSKDSLVGVKLGRNQYLLSTILAVLKSGAAYVPIDISYPKKRIEYIESDSDCRLVIDQIFLEKFGKVKESFKSTNPSKRSNLKDLAYIIYTSGSTGKPKGVMIEHGNFVELINWAKNEFDSSKFNWVYATTSHCFDLSIFEIFYPLVCGVKVKLLTNAMEINEHLKKDQYVLVNTVPSVIKSLVEEKPDYLKNISVLNLAGEVFPSEIIKILPLETMEVRNLYGPSEDTTYSTFYRITGKEVSPVPIGKPISNSMAYVLDDNMELLPVGVVGKLYLSGKGVARGYLKRPNLTMEKFLKNPFHQNNIIYDTGDFARWNLNGNLEFLGRKDEQVKLNGYRIELGEIENAILKFSDEIKKVVVKLKEVNAKQSLVAYYKSNARQQKSSLIGYLKGVLPKHLIPSFYEELDEIPLTLNGKVDKNALPDVVRRDLVRKRKNVSLNVTEKKLIDIWETVLGIKNIGIDDDFFSLGGHSLMIFKIINESYKKIGLDISVKMFYQNPTIKALSNKASSTKFKPIPKAPTAFSYPATDAQNRLWWTCQLEGASKAYQILGAKEIKGFLDVEVFQRAYDYVIHRHEILRTYFKTNDKGVLHQFIIDSKKVEESIIFKDLSLKERPLKVVNSFIEKDAGFSFDLERIPLIKAHLFKLNVNHYIFSLNMHHIIGDGWSLEVFTDEILKAYKQFLDYDCVKLPELNIQFKDYAHWFSQLKKEEAYVISKKYWSENFDGELPVLQLPTFATRPFLKTYKGEQIRNNYSSKELLNIKMFSKKYQVSIFTTLMAALKALLGRYSNQYDIIFGTSFAGRIHPDLERQLGLYVNTLPIRTKFKGTDTFLSLLYQEKHQLELAYEHQSFPLDTLLEQLKLKRDTSRTPFFDIMVVLQSQKQLLGLKNDTSFLNLEIKNYDVKKTTAQFDISFVFTEQSNSSLSLEVSYNTDIYSKNFITRLLAHLKKVIRITTSNPLIAINEIDFLSSEEKEYLLNTLNDNKTSFHENKVITDMFTKQVERSPNSLAIVCRDQNLTYSDLEKKSNQFANYLSKQDVFIGDCVGLQLDRSVELIIAILAILKLGACYVPIDLNSPDKRLNFILEDINAKLLIDLSYLDEIDFSSMSEEYEINKSKIDNSVNAYIIYTSGSTGVPKGVPITHKSLVNFLKSYELEICRTSLTCNYIFDVSVMEIFAAITSGSTLVIPPLEIVNNPKKYADFLYENRINHAYLHPMHLEEIAIGLSKYPEVFLKRILIGVESIKKEAVQWFYEKGIKIFNGYGPSEATICTTFYEINNLKDINTPNIPIGKPLSNYQVYILNQHSETLEMSGVVGELCISGIGLTKGYLNANTSELDSFSENPFLPGQNLYRTGDLARWLPDGNLEFIGRKDQQIKINGNRIELAEIESTILSYPITFDHVFVEVKKVFNQKSIIAYLKSFGDIDKRRLRNYLKDRLPHYMIPNYFIVIEGLPLTSNGKIDRKNFPEITEKDRIRNEYIAPKSLYEKKVVGIWEEVLKVKDIGLNDDFFELGGHSLVISILVNQYQKLFKVDVDLKDIYKNTTPAKHAKILSVAKESQESPIISLEAQEYYDVSSVQLRFWLIFNLRGKTKEFNIYDRFKLPSSLDTNVFEFAFNQLVERHEVLRTVFKQFGNTPKQRVINHHPIKIPIHGSKELENIKNDVFGFEFDLNIFPLYKIALIGEKGNYLLLFNIHHIISDGWSMRIIYEELIELYEAKLFNRKVNLPSLEVHYKDYSNWHNRLLASDTFESQKKYWLKNLSGELPYIQLPADYKLTNKSINSGSEYYTIRLDHCLKKDIELLTKQYKVSVFAFFLSSLNVILNKITSIEDIIVGIAVANRNHYQLKNMIGCFLNTLMIRNKINNNSTFESFLSEVNDTLINALVNQSYPFENVLEDLNIQRGNRQFPISSVFFNMLDFEMSSRNELPNFSPKNGKLIASPKFDFECYLKSYANGYELKCVFDPKVFELGTIRYWIDEYSFLLKQLTEKPGKRIKDLIVFDVAIPKSKTFLPKIEFDCFESSAINQSIVQRFEEQVLKFPNHLAVACEGRFLTYKELNNRANYIGTKILENTKQSSVRIALLINHQEESILCMLACLKAGCSYVPIDMTTPVGRVQYIVKDAECKLMISCKVTEQKANQLQSKMKSLSILNISSLKVTPTKNLNIQVSPNEEAYILYTSGSTGIPKGVIQNHRNVLHYVRVYTNSICINRSDNLSLFSTYSFDASVKDIYGALLNGAKVCIYDIIEKGLHNLSKWLFQERITIMHMVPTVYRYFIQELDSEEVLERVRILDLGGESCHFSDFISFKKHFTKKAFFVNDYGPTEATIISQNFLSHKDIVKKHNISLGQAVTETEVFLLDEQNNKLGIYQEGEIAYKSPYLSLGYLNRNELTANTFLYIDSLGGRVYKSGDLGRMLPSGEIEFLGRKDNQVKLNGQRIELLEIEQYLIKIPEIEQAVVLLKKIDGKNKLVAYVESKSKVNQHVIVSFLSYNLPFHMIPLSYIFLTDFPRTRTGKLDRKKLSLLSFKQDEKDFIKPRNELEFQIIKLVSKSLNIDANRVGIDDNFFDLGGSSLKMIKICNQLNDTLNMDLDLLTLFTYPSVRLLVDKISGTKSKQELAITDDISESIDDIIDLMKK